MGRAGSSCSDSPHGPRCLIAPLSHGPHLERGATHHLIQKLLEGGDLQGVKGKGEAGHTTQRECNDAEWAAAMRHGPAVSGAGGTAHARPPAAPAGHWAAWRARRRRAGTTAACPRCGPPPVAGKGMGGGLVWGQGPLASASAGLCRNRVPHGAGGLDNGACPVPTPPPHTCFTASALTLAVRVPSSGSTRRSRAEVTCGVEVGGASGSVRCQERGGARRHEVSGAIVVQHASCRPTTQPHTAPGRARWPPAWTGWGGTAS